MSDTQAIDPVEPSETEGGVEASPATDKPRRPGRLATLFAALALLLSIAIVGAGIYAYFYVVKPLQSARSTLETANSRLESEHQGMVAEINTRLQGVVTAVDAANQAERDTQSRFQGFESQLSQLRGQAHWSQREWVLAEVQYLLRIADDRLKYMRDVGTTQAAVRSALLRLDQLADPALAPIRQGIQRDLQVLMQYKRTDPVATLGRLEALITALQALPSAGRREAPTVPGASAEAAAPDNTEVSKAPGFLQKLTQGLGDRIRVIHHDNALDALARNTVDQQAYNLLRLRLESLRLTLLQEDATGYRRELETMEQWVGAMLEPAAAKPIQMELRGLRDSSPFTTLPSLEGSISQMGALLDATGASAPTQSLQDKP